MDWFVPHKPEHCYSVIPKTFFATPNRCVLDTPPSCTVPSFTRSGARLASGVVEPFRAMALTIGRGQAEITAGDSERRMSSPVEFRRLT
jgi:hypothetical protein